MRKQGICGMCLFTLTLGAAVGANGSQGEEPPYQLDELVVRPARNVLLEPSRESAALDLVTDRLSATDLQRVMPLSAGDALAAAPGIHTESRGRKYKQFHSFRGQMYPYPDVVFDGIWQRDAHELFYVFPGAMIEEIEIVRSPSTLFHGLADVVGVIDVSPRRAKLQPGLPSRTTLGAEGGSHGTARAFGFHDAQPAPGQAWTVGGQYYRTDGRSGRNAAEEFSSGFGSYLHQPSPDHRLRAGAWLLSGSRELEQPDPDGPASNQLKNRAEKYDPIRYGHINLRGHHRWSEQTTTEWKTFYSDRQARYTRTKLDPDGPGPGNAVDDEDDREYGAQLIQGVALTPDNTLRIGAFVHRWTAPDGKQSYTGSRQDVSSYAIVLSDEQQIGDWTLDIGGRYARSYFHSFSGPAFTITGRSTSMRREESEWDDAVLSGTAGAALALTEWSRLFTHAGVGTRRPGPGSVRADGSAPDTEQRYTADTGWEATWGATGSGRLTLAAFGVWRQDAITRINETGIDAQGEEFHFSGNRDLRQYGLEAALRTPGLWDDRLFLFGGCTWMRSEEKAHGSYRKHREIPSLNLTAGLQLETGIWDAAITLKHVDDYANFRFAQDGEYHDLGNYWDVALSGGVRVGRDRNLRLYARIDNVLDDTYSTVVGWSDPGRRFRVGAEATF